ncbi:MAG: 30S ribosomal protein THX [Bacteroidetes bacterium]|nr:MAG: 30S ribosomal protein THX [Bacteroidota bacterium]
MGKGDMKTRRGKIFRGTYGKLRPRDKSAKNPVGVKPETKAKAKTKK